MPRPPTGKRARDKLYIQPRELSSAVSIDGIQVDEITTSKTGAPLYRGRVQFSVTTRFDKEDDREVLHFEIPFRSPNLDEAVRAGLYVLQLVGERIAEAAQQTASSIGHDLKDFRRDAS
jgi:hypothetical protein